MDIQTTKMAPIAEHDDLPESHGQLGMADGALYDSLKPLQFARGKRKGSPPAFRLLAYGTDALADWEIVELILQSGIGRSNTATLAKALIAKFGSLGGVVSANVYELDSVVGVGRREVAILKAVQAVAARLIKAKLKVGQLLHDWDKISEYLTSVLSYETVEQLRIMFLNRKNALIGEELHSRGTVDHVPVYPREVVKRALEMNASAVILAHNHPSGNLTPSAADIEMTIKIKGALDAVGIILHDHIIVGPETLASFRTLRILPFAHVDPDEPYHRLQPRPAGRGRN